ncbi:hypothetical protein CLOM_g20143 [Closterium sp. NIES-68]|nr:hypothetical protein CLOM_g20143 [Closterium sp. NIES-68]GJP68120.1 hypothetical protein CLOP_g24863 [Closterium sp. NIES-67]
MVPMVSPHPASRDRPSFPMAFGAKLAPADIAAKPRPHHPSIRFDTAQHDLLDEPPQPPQCAIRALDARKPFIAAPLRIPCDASSNPGDDASSSSSPASFPVLSLFAHHSALKPPPPSSRPPARSPRPSLPRPRSPCLDFSALSNSPRCSPGTNFGRVARPAPGADGTPPDAASPSLPGGAAAPPPQIAPQQAQWFALPIQRPEVLRAAAAQTSRCASPDTPLGFVTSPSASSPSCHSPGAPKPRSSLSSSLPPSSPRPSSAARAQTTADAAQAVAFAFTCADDVAAGGSNAGECAFGGDYAESNVLVVGGSSRSVSSAGSAECGESCGAFDRGNAAAILKERPTDAFRRSFESADSVAKRAAADAARKASMGIRRASLCGRVEGRAAVEVGAQAERELSRNQWLSMPRGAGLVAAWGGHAGRASPLSAPGQEAPEETAERAERDGGSECGKEGGREWEGASAGHRRRRSVDDVSDAISCGGSSVSDGRCGSHGGEAEQGEWGGEGAEAEEGGSESDWFGESTTCLNLESVEQLCAQMEFQKKTIDAIHIVPLPARSQISMERPRRALSRAAVAGAGGGGAGGVGGSGSAEAGAAGWPLGALSVPPTAACLLALRCMGSLDWHTPGDPELWERERGV